MSSQSILREVQNHLEKVRDEPTFQFKTRLLEKFDAHISGTHQLEGSNLEHMSQAYSLS